MFLRFWEKVWKERDVDCSYSILLHQLLFSNISPLFMFITIIFAFMGLYVMGTS